jgi:hypothetical protein
MFTLHRCPASAHRLFQANLSWSTSFGSLWPEDIVFQHSTASRRRKRWAVEHAQLDDETRVTGACFIWKLAWSGNYRRRELNRLSWIVRVQQHIILPHPRTVLRYCLICEFEELSLVSAYPGSENDRFARKWSDLLIAVNGAACLKSGARC